MKTDMSLSTLTKRNAGAVATSRACGCGARLIERRHARNFDSLEAYFMG
jgi:hypothetical protein